MPQRVTVATFATHLDAQLARVRLEQEGIASVVIEPFGFNGVMHGTVAGVQLEVDTGLAERAHGILAEPLPEEYDELSGPMSYRDARLVDDEPDARVRCPQCEQEYCSFERPRFFTLIRQTKPWVLLLCFAGLFPLVLAYTAIRCGERKRWRCHKCEYVWDDLAECPKTITRAGSHDPRLALLLERRSAGMGLMFGALVGAIVGAVLDNFPIAFAVGGVAGFLIGYMLTSHVCSEPTCRTPARLRDEACSKCHAKFIGVIDEARLHHVHLAEARRENARQRAEIERRAARKKLKKATKAEPRGRARAEATAAFEALAAAETDAAVEAQAQAEAEADAQAEAARRAAKVVEEA